MASLSICLVVKKKILLPRNCCCFAVCMMFVSCCQREPKCLREVLTGHFWLRVGISASVLLFSVGSFSCCRHCLWQIICKVHFESVHQQSTVMRGLVIQTWKKETFSSKQFFASVSTWSWWEILMNTLAYQRHFRTEHSVLIDQNSSNWTVRTRRIHLGTHF